MADLNLAEEEDDEVDLFGDDEDSDTGGGASAPAAKAKAAPDDDLQDLFGSDDEGASAPAAKAKAAADDEDDVSERDLFGSDDEGDDYDEKELFGSEDEAAENEKAQASGEAAAGTPQPAPSEVAVSEMDEREIFGDMSDDEEVEKEEDVVIRRRPAPAPNRVFVPLRLPNVLTVETTSYRGVDSIPQSMLEGYKEYKDTRGRNVVKLLNPENCLRWRFKKGPDGQILTDDDGRPQYESNARIVQWDDGSRHLFVGKESFKLTDVEERNVAIFEENSSDVLVCHGIVNQRLIAIPRSMASETHDMLKKSQYRKYEPVRRSILLKERDDANAAKQLADLEKEDAKRREKRKAQGGDALPGMSVGFLEDDDAAAGPSIADLKRQHGQGGRPAKRPKNEGSPAA